MPHPRLSAVVPTFNGGELLDRCLDALAGEDAVEEVIVLDGGSDDGSDARAARRARVRVLRLPGTSVQRRLNHGVDEAANELVLHLDGDAFVDPGTPDRLAEVMEEEPRLAVVAARLRSEDHSLQKSVGDYRTLGSELLGIAFLAELSPRRVRLVPRPKVGGVDHSPWVQLSCGVLRRSAFRAVGGFDERFSFYYDDLDFCRRLVEDGWMLAVCWDAGAVHLGGGSTRQKDAPKWFGIYHANRLVYLRKHYPRGWLIYAALWPLRALLHVAGWRLRALRHRRRGDFEGERVALRWAEVFRASIRLSARPHTRD